MELFYLIKSSLHVPVMMVVTVTQYLQRIRHLAHGRDYDDQVFPPGIDDVE